MTDASLDYVDSIDDAGTNRRASDAVYFLLRNGYLPILKSQVEDARQAFEEAQERYEEATERYDTALDLTKAVACIVETTSELIRRNPASRMPDHDDDGLPVVHD